MIRFLVIAGLVYFGYRALKSVIGQGSSRKVSSSDRSTGKIDDVMIKDPYCESYFPKRDGVLHRYNGEDLYFCSENCKAKFIEMKK
ncbi:MAG: YHS domain-containing protein [Deltaproteobacteria bacterium]|nr:YHS domain-containing protein [Deltaproteobacteria bacterium]MBW1845900.1 YHS domain-containing protein [Deltaproteobacteria bacterium]MBW1984003.1 YHS domain-containing protein [Deltaproteobacteria bacterium]MBW2180636.1 YHS domain-containing protein [Deltaproteobacteria bacterium]MBW2364941.1 YHS domain-containing protein [Deltaproteobacteria bacterium]